MKRETGFSLLEVLIAVLVLAIGLLGLAGLQMFGLRSNHSANLRTQATLLAYDMTDRARANLTGYNQGYYDNQTPSTHHCVWDGSAPATCTARQMAQQDVFEWNAAVTQNLPQGMAVVCLDSTPNDGGDTDGDGTVEATELDCDASGSTYAVKLWWVDDYSVAGNPVIKRFVTVVRP